MNHRPIQCQNTTEVPAWQESGHPSTPRITYSAQSTNTAVLVPEASTPLRVGVGLPSLFFYLCTVLVLLLLGLRGAGVEEFKLYTLLPWVTTF